MTTKRKYTKENLIPMFRKAAKFRDEMNNAGFTDNGGAIHSAERILNILGCVIRYPGLSHQNDLRFHDAAEFSDKAWRAFQKGQKIEIEHVAPHRDLTRNSIRIINEGKSDRQLTNYIRKHYRLVLLTPTERASLDNKNRSKMEEDRLEKAGIKVATRKKRSKKRKQTNKKDPK